MAILLLFQLRSCLLNKNTRLTFYAMAVVLPAARKERLERACSKIPAMKQYINHPARAPGPVLYAALPALLFQYPAFYRFGPARFFFGFSAWARADNLASSRFFNALARTPLPARGLKAGSVLPCIYIHAFTLINAARRFPPYYILRAMAAERINCS